MVRIPTAEGTDHGHKKRGAKVTARRAISQTICNEPAANSTR